IANRLTQVGDMYLENDVPVAYTGLPVIGVDYFPDADGSNHDQTRILVTAPNNIQIGIYRQFRMKSFDDISNDGLKVNITVRADAKVAVTDATSQTTAVSVA